MESIKFRELYNKLNPQQRKAVDTIEGPVMVIAGPGTGKTQILTLRIANILLQTDVEPSNILALTFTESGAVAMRRRLVEIIGSPAYYVTISTFHGFCNEIIRNHPEEFAHLASSRNITEIEQIQLMARLIEETKLTALKPYGAPLLFLRPALSAINDLKREGVTPSMFADIVKEEEEEFSSIADLYHTKGAHKGKMKGVYQEKQKHIAKNKELALLYASYQEALKEKGLYDYNDMILEVIAALEKNPDLLLEMQEQYQYILVDEHQDTNTAQNKLLELLASFYDNPNLFVVGDEKQSIFRFQGASLANFLYFQKRYPSAALVTLRESYRSTQRILDAARCVVEPLEVPDLLKKAGRELLSRAGHPEAKISVRRFVSPDAEFHFIARDIEKKIREGVKPEEIAVLYRDNRDVFEFVDILQTYDVPFVIESDEDLLKDWDVRKLLLLFRAIEHFGEEEYLVPVLHIDFLKADPHDVYLLMKIASERRISLWDAIRQKKTYAQGNFENPEALRRIYTLFSSWKTLSQNTSLPQLFGIVLRESGFLAHLQQNQDFIDKMDKVFGLFEEVKRFCARNETATCGDFLSYVAMLEDQGILIKKEQTYRRPGSVRLMTAHRSKGLEFDYVYIIKCRDGHWSNRRKIDHIKLPARILPRLSSFDPRESARGEGNEEGDDRRLFYVALTRARKHVTISFSEFSREGKEYLPAQFVEEILPDLKEETREDAIEQELLQDASVLFAPPKERGRVVRDTEFFRELFLQRGLSVTGLNNYLRCPWRYFYVNLLRVPQTPSKHQMYGIAIHEALRRFFEKRNSGEASRDFLLASFEEELQRQAFTPAERAESREKGRVALGGYYDRWHGEWPERSLSEFHAKAAFSLPDRGFDVQRIQLQGKLDRVDFLGEGRVLVVDYKTGAPKSRAFIEGKTKDSEGGYMMRQLVFYKLLLDLYGKDGMKMELGRIDFVEPDKNGNFRREDFFISDAHVEELKDCICRTAGEILNLSFWDRSCENEKCEFCRLREML